MTPADFQHDLIQAESLFDLKKELTLWQAGSDLGLLIVGRLGNRWYSALRCNVGKIETNERLDSEQKSYKTRALAIDEAGSRAVKWLEANLGRDGAKGFLDAIKKAVLAEADKVE